MEGDLKITQETVVDLERVKAELSQSAQRKEKEARKKKRWEKIKTIKEGYQLHNNRLQTELVLGCKRVSSVRRSVWRTATKQTHRLNRINRKVA